MATFFHDVKFGLRMLGKNPGFTVIAVLTLALGIGAATTIFSVIYNVLFDPYPYKDSNRVMSLQIRDADHPDQSGRGGFQTPEFLDYMEQSKVFEDAIGGDFEDELYTTSERTEQMDGGLMSANTFSFLGVAPMLGRMLTPEDAKPGAPPVFLLSYKGWSKYFNSDPTVVGKTFTLNGAPITLVGVMPKRFTKLGVDVYKPVILDRADAKMKDEYFRFQGKLKPGISIQQAEAELNVVAHRLSKIYPHNYPASGRFFVKLVSWVDSNIGPFRKTLYILGAAVGLLLLIACGNVANMLLARATAREKEMAIRASLGARRGRLIRQLLIESVLLAVLGMGIGCLFAHFGLKALLAATPADFFPGETDIRLNMPVLIFSVAVAGLTAILFGLVPALLTMRRDLVEPLKERKTGGGGFRQGKLRKSLVIFEVALSLVLLVGAGLLMRSFVKLTKMDLGFQPDHMLIARVPLPKSYDKTKLQFFRQFLSRMQTLPGVNSVTVGTWFPPWGGYRSEIDIPGKEHAQERWDSIFQLTSEGYFKTLGMHLLRGRLFSDVDVNDAHKVVVINQALANRYFGTDDPIGRQIKFNRLGENGVTNPVFEVIGVVADVKNRGLAETPVPESFAPYTITSNFDRVFMLRTTGKPEALINTVRREIWAMDRVVAVTMLDTMDNFLLQYSYAQPRFALIVLGVFAAVGLVLVALGVYSVIAYTVSRQTQDIGIRMALGAQRSHVLWLVLRHGMMPALIGIIIGAIAAFALTRIMSSLLFGIEATDPLTFAGVSLLLLAIALFACWLPARRATKVDPMTALRYE